MGWEVRQGRGVTAQGDRLDLLVAQLDLKGIAWLEIQQAGVDLAHPQVAVELLLDGMAELEASAAPTFAALAKAETLGLQQGS